MTPSLASGVAYPPRPTCIEIASKRMMALFMPAETSDRFESASLLRIQLQLKQVFKHLIQLT